MLDNEPCRAHIAMQAGVANHVWSVEEIVTLLN
jgi:hypothetical protein